MVCCLRDRSLVWALVCCCLFFFYVYIVFVYYDIVTAVYMFQLSCVLSNISSELLVPRLQMFSLRCIIEAMVFVDMFTFCPLSNMCPTAKHPHRKPRAMPSLLLRSNPIWRRPTPRKVITTMLWPLQRRWEAHDAWCVPKCYLHIFFVLIWDICPLLEAAHCRKHKFIQTHGTYPWISDTSTH